MNAKTLSRSAVAAAVAVALSAGYVAGHRDVPAPAGHHAGASAMMPAEAAAKTGIPILRSRRNLRAGRSSTSARSMS